MKKLTLTEAMKHAIKKIAQYNSNDDGWVTYWNFRFVSSTTMFALAKRGFVERHTVNSYQYRLTDAGRALAIELGFIATPAATQPDAPAVASEPTVTRDEIKALIMAEFGIEPALQWFSEEFDTLAEAKTAAGEVDWFSLYGVLQKPNGKYVWANMRKHWKKSEMQGVADGILKATGMQLVEYTAALFGWWPMNYPDPTPTDPTPTSAIEHFNAPSDDAGDQLTPDVSDVDNDILLPNDVVEILPLFMEWRGAVTGVIVDVDMEYCYEYGVVYKVDDKWYKRYWRSIELVKLSPVIEAVAA